MKETVMEEAEIVIVGGGVIGLACALRLASDGAEVLLIDRDEPGMGCSRGNAAHIATELIFPLASPQSLRALPYFLFNANSPLVIDPGYAVQAAPWLLRFAKSSLPHRYRRGVTALTSIQSIAAEEISSLLHAAGAGNLLHRRGHLMLVEDAASKSRAKQQCLDAAPHGIRTEWKDASEVMEMAPDVTRNIAGAVYYPDTGHTADPLSVSRKLLDAFVKKGGRVVQDRIDTASPQSTAGFQLQGTTRRYKAAKLIIAAGAWSHHLSRQLGCPAPLEAERGYNISLSDYQPKMSVPVSSFERNVIMTPIDKSLRITGFVEFAGLKKPANQANIEKLKTHLKALVPQIDLSNATSWLGHRPSLPDYLPVISKTRKCKNLYFAFGHQHLGLTLAGATASMMSAMVNDKEGPIDAAPFSIDRFQ